MSSDLYKQKRELLKQKRELRKKIMGRDGEKSSMQRVYGEKTKTVRAIKVEMFGSKSKASGTDGQETSIETFVKDCLVENGLKFVEQKAIRFVNVDFFLPEFNLVIQAEGCYFHVCPKCYPKGPKNQQQIRFLEKDKQSEEIVLGAGYKLLKIWHHEIIEDAERVKQIIRDIK